MILSSKSVIRIVSFIAAGMFAMAGLIVKGNIDGKKLQTQIESGYVKAFQEIAASLSSITIGLEKTGFAGSPAQIARISAQICYDAGTAKSALADLPSRQSGLDATNLFLSQVGDYAMALSKKSMNGVEPSEKEQSEFRKLAEYARVLSNNINVIERTLSSGQIPISQYLKTQSGVEAPLYEGVKGFQDVEDGFIGYPALMYDGPFSDNILRKSPVMTKGLAEIPPDEARITASKFANVDSRVLMDTGTEESLMPSYIFSAPDIYAAVTKHGGFTAYMINSRVIGDRAISDNAARRKAMEYLRSVGIESMRESYYESSNGICTVNFAYEQDGIICYTDLIKVGVALDLGDVVYYDARGYINNHSARSFPDSGITAEQAGKALNKDLTVKRRRLVLIPSSGGTEILAYEFLCSGREHDALIYINAENGAEERILMIIEGENGVVTV